MLGKVFWAGALAEMGDRDPAEVEQALHELARKELVRPARTSSMEGEREYGFWHVLVRDVCYGQIPRAGRAARHQAAAAWIEEKAGERVEDLADVLAHHYQSALELNRAAGGDEQRGAAGAGACATSAMAGERALSLDVDQAERQLARALELCPATTPRAPSLLERWAHAVQQQGRLQEAREALEQALDLYREQDDPVAVGRVLTRLGNVIHRLGDPRCEEMHRRGGRAARGATAGPELVVRLHLPGRAWPVHERDPRGVAGAERALALAAELGLPEPAFALHLRGLARSTGDEGGIDDLRAALSSRLEQGSDARPPSSTATSPGRSGVSRARKPLRWSSARRSPSASGAESTEMALQNRSGIPALLAELGQTEQALAEAGRSPTGSRRPATWPGLPRACACSCSPSRRARQAPDLGPLLAAAREIGLPIWVALARCRRRGSARARAAPSRAHTLRELDGARPRGTARTSGGS